MSSLKAGTPCFLVNLVRRPELAGRVVEVIGPCPTPAGEVPGDEWFAIAAEWTDDVLWPGAELVAPRRCLLPLLPDADQDRDTTDLEATHPSGASA